MAAYQLNLRVDGFGEFQNRSRRKDSENFCKITISLAEISCKMSAEEDTKAKNDKEKEKFETLKEMVLLLNQKAATLSTQQRHDEVMDTLKSCIEFCND